MGTRSIPLAIKGVPLPQPEFDSAVLLGAKTAMMKFLTAALDIDEAEVRHRFAALFDKNRLSQAILRPRMHVNIRGRMRFGSGPAAGTRMRDEADRSETWWGEAP